MITIVTNRDRVHYNNYRKGIKDLQYITVLSVNIIFDH